MLIGNRSVLLKSPGRFLAGTIASTDRSGWSNPGMMRSAAYPALAGLPNGYYAGAWFLPKTAGALSSAYNARIDLGLSGLAVGGVTSDATAAFALTPAATAWPLDDSVQIRTASASITFTVADAAGQLISSGEGAAAGAPPKKAKGGAPRPVAAAAAAPSGDASAEAPTPAESMVVDA